VLVIAWTLLACFALSSSSSLADDSPAVSGTSVTVAPQSGTTALPGVSVSGYDPSQGLLVSLSTTLGTLSLGEDNGLTLSYGYAAFTDTASMSFSGTEGDVDAALATLSLTGTGASGTASVQLTVTTDGGGTVAYLPATGHYYEYVADAGLAWTQAQADAQSMTFAGQSGYLASIPNATVNSFINDHLDGAENVWVGGMAVDYPGGYDGDTNVERVWSWQGGPLQGTIFTECSNIGQGGCAFVTDQVPADAFTDWNWGEPNNDGYPWAGDPGEHYLEINEAGSLMWNDFPNDNGATSGYVVEFGNLSGGGDFSGVYSVTSPVALAGTPGAPTAVAASAGADSATVTWDPPDSDGGAPITGYTVSVAPGGETCTTSTTSCTLAGLDAGTAYTFTVVATNAVATSVASSASLPVTPLVPPAAPVPTPTPAPTTIVTPPSPTVYTSAIAQGVCRVMRHDVVQLRSLSVDTNTGGTLVSQVWVLAKGEDRRGMLARAPQAIAHEPTVIGYRYHGSARSFVVILTVTNSAGLSSTKTIHCTTSESQRKPALSLTLPASKLFVGAGATLTPWGRYYLHWRIRRLLRHDVAGIRAVGEVAPGATAADSALALARAQAVLSVLAVHLDGPARSRAQRPRQATLRYGVERTHARTGQRAPAGYGPSIRLIVTYAPA
jgi:hypothetical protein